jgi:hypothetical protein
MDTQNHADVSTFVWRESTLAEKFGCGLPALATWRKNALVEGQGFERVKNAVCYSPESAKNAALAFGLTGGDLSWPQIENGALAPSEPPPGPVVVVLYVSRRACANRWVLNASKEAGGWPLLRVTDIKTKDNFRPGMPLDCVHVGGDLYRFVGRLPRRPGKY